MCWFSNDPYPVEIKVCLDSWKRIIPDYQIKLWGYNEAKAISCDFIDEALRLMSFVFMQFISMEAFIWIATSSFTKDLTDLFLKKVL